MLSRYSSASYIKHLLLTTWRYSCFSRKLYGWSKLNLLIYREFVGFSFTQKSNSMSFLQTENGVPLSRSTMRAFKNEWSTNQVDVGKKPTGLIANYKYSVSIAVRRLWMINWRRLQFTLTSISFIVDFPIILTSMPTANGFDGIKSISVEWSIHSIIKNDL